MKEQIEEMAKDLGIAFQLAGTTRFGAVADVLVNAGYRKQSEGKWIWTESGEADCEKYWVCSVCKEHDFVKTNYCPSCGAKMKGGAE